MPTVHRGAILKRGSTLAVIDTKANRLSRSKTESGPSLSDGDNKRVAAFLEEPPQPELPGNAA